MYIRPNLKMAANSKPMRVDSKKFGLLILIFIATDGEKISEICDVLIPRPG